MVKITRKVKSLICVQTQETLHKTLIRSFSDLYFSRSLRDSRVCPYVYILPLCVKSQKCRKIDFRLLTFSNMLKLLEICYAVHHLTLIFDSRLIIQVIF